MVAAKGSGGNRAGRQKSHQKSPAEFFAENKTIAGFDTPAKSLYTSVRELVENSLDAAEKCNALPDVQVTLEEVSLERFQKLYGIEATQRIDTALYKDTETAKERLRREKQEDKLRRDLEKEALKKSKKTGEAVDHILRRQEAGKKAAATRTKRTFYRLTCRDNGCGMPSDDIPNMLGRVLSSTKYNAVQQTRGKFGLGAKMVLIWSQMRVSQPMEVMSTVSGGEDIAYYRFNIDLHKNAPIVKEHKMIPNDKKWRGTEISVLIEGNWASYKAKLLRYLKLIAIITPYASFDFRYVAEDERNYLHHHFSRRTDQMPPPPQVSKHHPSDVDLELLKKIILLTHQRKLHQFLCKEFSNITPDYAERIIKELKSDAKDTSIDRNTAPKQMNEKQILRLHNLMHQVRFGDPDGKCLSPAGEYNLRLGVMKELNPDMVATFQGDAKALEGNAFIVEAAVSIGGKDNTVEQNQLNVFRFANRIPLLFEQGNDVITRTAQAMKWNKYKIFLEQRVGVFVSIVSTKIPFKGTSKEYIGECDEISSAVQHALNQCALQLKSKLSIKENAKAHEEKKKSLFRYIPDVSSAVFAVLKNAAAAADAITEGEDSNKPPGSGSNGMVNRKKRGASDIELLQKVRKKSVSVASLTEALRKYVDKLNAEEGLEYQMNKSGSMGTDQARDDVCIGSPDQFNQTNMYRLKNRVCTLQILSG